MTETIRASIHAALVERDWHLAAPLMRQLLHSSPNPATAQFILRCFENNCSRPDLKQYKVAFLRSFALEPILPLLQAAAALNGIGLTAHLSDFNAYTQEILNASSRLYEFDPQAVFLAVQTQDFVPDLWCRYAELSPDEVEKTIETAQVTLDNLISSFRLRHRAYLVVHNFEVPPFPASGLLDAQAEKGQIEAIREVNRALVRIAREKPGVYVLDYDSLISRFGRLRWRDERKWLMARMPISATGLIHFAEEYVRFLLPLASRTCKALAVDLDNTLWGGIIGEDGLNGIQLGPEYPGAAYVALQRAILDLYKRGMILAICSKNNPEDGLEALEKHPHMLLRRHHFAAVRVNWNDKAQNLREIAEELNIGMDSLAFLDDSPQERECVRRELPEVFVIDLPAEPMEFSLTLRQCPVFERLKLSEEDRERSRYYAEERQRKNLEKTAGSLENFYESLQMAAEIGLVSSDSLPRVAQLTQKTNQFNLTTQRYTEQEIRELLEDPSWRVYYLRASDKFGDSGIVGVAMTRQQQETVEISSFLMSCRVIGRTLETAFLAYLVQEATEQGAHWLRGRFIPTKKNAPARDFYASHGFHLIKQQENGESLWELDLRNTEVSCPDWIRCTFTKSCVQNL
jgi:FkbH-like protein